jgi:transcriptional regulator with XRE-family HTH domain
MQVSDASREIRGVAVTGGRNRSELANFLRNRRARIAPQHVGLPFGRRRRTPGLRREEIAVLAGLSPTWYTYLEQGRDIRPSSEVLESLARVLQLTEAERRYLHLLADGRPRSSPVPAPRPGEVVLPQLVASVGKGAIPVYAIDAVADICSWNELATVWYADFAWLPPAHRNILWWMLLAPEARERIVDWEDEARGLLASFRLATATRPRERRYQELVAELRGTSPEFREWWPEHDVCEQQTRLRRFRLPGGQVRTVRLVVLQTVDTANSIVLHLPLDGTDSANGTDLTN